MKKIIIAIICINMTSCTKNCFECKWQENQRINGINQIINMKQTYCKGDGMFEFIELMKNKYPDLKQNVPINSIGTFAECN